jgi:hypothetical protein
MIEVIKTLKLGLEIYEVYHDSTLVGTFLAKEFAVTAAKRLKNKLKACNI